MAGGEGINQVGGVPVQSQPQTSEEGIHEAKNPQRVNHSSIESLPETERKLPSSSKKTREFKPLSARKVAHQALGKFRLLLSRPKKQASLQDLGGVQQQNKALSTMFERQASKTAQNKPQAEARVDNLQDGLRWAKTNRKKASKLADSAMLKQSVADKTGVPAQLTSVEKGALQELEHANQLVDQFQGKLAEAKTIKSEFKAVEKLKDSFAAKLEKLEGKVSEASRVVNARFTPLSVSDHKARVSDLEKKLASVESALKDLNQLKSDVAGAEENHSGATPRGFNSKARKLLEKAEAVRGRGPEVLEKAKNKRDQQIQKKHVELGKQTRRSSTPEVQSRSQTQPQKSQVKKSASLNDLDKLQPVRNKSASRSRPASSGLSGKTSWTPADQALENRLKRLKGQVVHDRITPSGDSKNFAQLEAQLNSISSVDDLKAVVADRRSSKITPKQQERYLGLLSAAVQGMAKNSQFAAQMNEDLIKDVLKEQPSEARAAIKKMHNTHADDLQRRLDRLKGK